MPIINRSYFDAAQKGRDAAQQEQSNALLNRARTLDVTQGEYANKLMQDPTTTAEQFARAGRSDIGNALTGAQNSATAQKQTQAKQFAEQVVAATKYTEQVPPEQTKAFVEKNFPFLVQTYGPEWATATPEQVRTELHGIGAKFGAQIGQAPEQEKFSAPQDYQFSDGPGIAQVGTNGTVRRVPGVKPIVKPPVQSASENFDPQSVENTAQMIANNQIPMISGFALRSKWGQEVVSRVRELNPGFSSADAKSREAALKQFTSGKNGNTIRSLNVAVQHLDQLGQLATALNNSDTPLLNRVSIAWKKETGQAAPTNFNAAKKIVADEIVKAIVGSGGGVADREEAAASINAASSPAQLQQVIETYTGLMAGQLNGIRQQYATATGRNDFESLLLPGTKSRLEAHGAEGASHGAEITATGPGGKKIVLRNGQWVPL
jgi:hypothetical protein